jgi:hypothetical protein
MSCVVASVTHFAESVGEKKAARPGSSSKVVKTVPRSLDIYRLQDRGDFISLKVARSVPKTPLAQDRYRRCGRGYILRCRDKYCLRVFTTVCCVLRSFERCFQSYLPARGPQGRG